MLLNGTNTRSMAIKNQIGLEPAETSTLADLLNDLLANYNVFYMNVRGFHWNIRGDKFFELHAKFEELYDDVLVKIDEIAERILTLGFSPHHSYGEYLKHAEIQPVTDVSDPRRAVSHVVEAFGILLTKERELLRLSADAEDEGTNSLMSDYIREQEKLVWMYSAYLGKE